MKRINEIIKEKENKTKGNTIDFGFNELNSFFSYVNEDGVITLFGHPAMGKTSFMLNLVSNISKNHNTSILYITTEHREEHIIDVLLSIESGVPLRKIKKECVNEMEIEQFESALAKVSNFSLYITDNLNKYCASSREIHELLRDFFSNEDTTRKKIVILDQYFRNPEIVESIRKSTKVNNAMLFILAPYYVTNDKTFDKELGIEDLDPYLNVISDCVIAIHRPSYFTTRISDDSAYICILKCPRISEGEIKYNFDFRTLKYEEEFLVYNLPFDLEMDFNDFDDIPF